MALSLGSLGGSLFDLHLGIDEKILRSLLVFAFLAIALRLGGKRELLHENRRWHQRADASNAQVTRLRRALVSRHRHV